MVYVQSSSDCVPTSMTACQFEHFIEPWHPAQIVEHMLVGLCPCHMCGHRTAVQASTCSPYLASEVQSLKPIVCNHTPQVLTVYQLYKLQEHKKNTLTPTWNERKWLMVQEPETQDLRVEVFDWDRLNVKDMLTINPLKGVKDSLGSKTIMGR